MSRSWTEGALADVAKHKTAGERISKTMIRRRLSPAGRTSTDSITQVDDASAHSAKNGANRDDDLSERIVDAIFNSEDGVSTTFIAAHLECPRDRIRVELKGLEQIEHVHRTGKTRGTLWHLG